MNMAELWLIFYFKFMKFFAYVMKMMDYLLHSVTDCILEYFVTPADGARS